MKSRATTGAALEPPASPGGTRRHPPPEPDARPAHVQHTSGPVLTKPSC